MERKKVIRRSYFIKRRLQWKVFVSVIAMLVSFTLFLAVGLYFPLFYILYSNLPTESVMLQHAAYFYLAIERYIWISVLAVIALLGLYSLFFSHRIAGPLYRFEQTLQGVGEGDLSQRVQLRRYDELKDLGDEINRTLDVLDTQVRRAKEMVSHAERAHSNLSALWQGQGAQGAEIDRNLSALKEATSRLGEILSPFKTSPPPGSEIASK